MTIKEKVINWLKNNSEVLLNIYNLILNYKIIYKIIYNLDYLCFSCYISNN